MLKIFNINIKKFIRNYLENRGWRIYRVQNEFFTYWTRPCYSCEVDYGTDMGNESDCHDCGIVVQGACIADKNFTIETLKLYKKIFPGAHIVLSTWNGEKAEILNMAREEGVIVCLSDDPPYPGHSNENRQRISTQAGIDLLKRNGCKYVLKTRTDQRIYECNVMCFFKNLLKEFPIKIATQASQRIIACSLSTFSNRLYNISEVVVFGTIDDMQRYFSPPEYISLNADIPSDQLEYSKQRRGEIYFASHYIESCGHKLLWSIEDSDYFRKNLFIIVDAESIDLFWPKYTEREYRWRRYKSDILKQVTFKDWFLEYCKD